MNSTEILKVFDLTPQDGQMILIGAVVFFFFWQVVGALIVTPFLALYEEREALTTGASESSKHLHDEALAIQNRSQELLHNARVAAMGEKIQALTAAKKEAAKIAENTEAEVQEWIRKARWQREQTVTETRQQVMGGAETLAKDIVSKFLQSIIFVIVMLAGATSAYAAEGHHEGSPSDLIPYWINFSVFVAGMFILLRKPISNGWVARRETISVAVNKGKIEQEAAEEALREAKAKEATIQSQIQELIAQIKKESTAEVQDILHDAKVRAERAKAQGDEMLAAEQKAFETQLKRELAETVVNRATELLKGKINADSDAGFRADAVNNIRDLVH